MEVKHIQSYFNAANYITVAQLYLKNNILINRNLELSDLKERFVGHWGTSTGLNFIYAHLNNFIKNHNIRTHLVVGTGHAAAAMNANLFLEGSMHKIINYTRDLDGLKIIINSFGKDMLFQTEITPHLPGVIYEGGELGHAISFSYGVALDSPNELVVVVIGDGELETGPALAGLNLNKVISAKKSGMVLPIVNLNGFKMSSPSIYSLLNKKELENLFRGFGYEPIIVNGDHKSMVNALEKAYYILLRIREHAQVRKYHHSYPPIIILKTPKGWTGIKEYNGVAVEGAAMSHKAPIRDFSNKESLILLEKWLLSYNPKNIIDSHGCINKSILKCLPSDKYKLGNSIIAKKDIQPLKIPSTLSKECCAYNSLYSPMRVLSDFLIGIYKNNKKFRIFSPDELESNQCETVVKNVKRQLSRKIPINANNCSDEGGVIEILSEHVCQGLLQGYAQSGKWGLFISYEAFIPIVSSMIIQYIKFLNQQKNMVKDLPSLNYVLSSLSWMNCYTHQNPDIYNTLLCANTDIIKLFTPVDANCLLACMELTLGSTNLINFTIASKHPLPVFFNIETYKRNLSKGYIVWPKYDNINPDITICSIGDINTAECYAAINDIMKMYPNIKIRFISILELSIIKNMSIEQFNSVFSEDSPILISFIGNIFSAEFIFRKFNNRNIEYFGYKDCNGVEVSGDVLKICEISYDKVIINIKRILNLT